MTAPAAAKAPKPKQPKADEAKGTQTTTPDVVDSLTEKVEPRLFDPGESAHVLSLADRFVFPPFTQFDTRNGDWQHRKRQWMDLGLRSKEGRNARMLARGTATGDKDEDWIEDPTTGERYLKGAPPGSVNAQMLAVSNGQSVFDPVLCELAYLWFCPQGGSILDPFAGGSVRGLVAGVTERHYTGLDLSHSQIEANLAQLEEWTNEGIIAPDWAPTWIQADSANLDEIVTAEAPSQEYDMVWSCPPYHDLEKYSKDPRDLSNMPWPQFVEVYRDIIGQAVDRLRDDRWAGFVVGEIRESDGPGFYRHFVQATIDAFELAGAAYYNEAIVINPVGTLRLRLAKQFLTSRKLGRIHQTVLLFCKGDPRRAAAACANNQAMEGALKALGVAPDELDAEPDVDYSGMEHG